MNPTSAAGVGVADEARTAVAEGLPVGVTESALPARGRHTRVDGRLAAPDGVGVAHVARATRAAMEAVYDVALGVGSAGGGVARVGGGAARYTRGVADELRQTEADRGAAHDPTARVGSAWVGLAVLASRN